jgi:amino acid transporter
MTTAPPVGPAGGATNVAVIDRSSPGVGRPVAPLAFLGVVVTSLGGPLALAALYAPSIVADATASAGLVMLAAAVVFLVPLAILLRYTRQVTGAGGLYGFVEAAAGRRVARVQAGIWVFSYLLYLLYTTASVVYDTLPAVLGPGVRPYQPALEIAMPVALAGVMLAGRTVTLLVTGLLAAGQLVLVAILAVVAIGHDAPVGSFGAGAPAGAALTATGQTALLYVCGSLPLFLGGELKRPQRTIPRGMIGGFLLVAVGVVAAVFPIAANPAFAEAPIPGMSIVRVFAGHGLAVAVGIGVAASVVGVMLVEYLSLSRLAHTLTGRPLRTVIAVIAGALVLAAPISLIDPDGFYDSLIKPSLVALWLSQLIVFAVYPRFVRKHAGRPVPAWTLTVLACAFAGYGLWVTINHPVS